VAGGTEGAAGAAEWWGRGEERWSGDEKLLAAGARVVAGLRDAVERRLGFTCSAGGWRDHCCGGGGTIAGCSSWRMILYCVAMQTRYSLECL